MHILSNHNKKVNTIYEFKFRHLSCRLFFSLNVCTIPFLQCKLTSPSTLPALIKRHRLLYHNVTSGNVHSCLQAHII